MQDRKSMLMAELNVELSVLRDSWNRAKQQLGELAREEMLAFKESASISDEEFPGTTPMGLQLAQPQPKALGDPRSGHNKTD